MKKILFLLLGIGIITGNVFAGHGKFGGQTRSTITWTSDKRHNGSFSITNPTNTIALGFSTRAVISTDSEEYITLSSNTYTTGYSSCVGGFYGPGDNLTGIKTAFGTSTWKAADSDLLDGYNYDYFETTTSANTNYDNIATATAANATAIALNTTHRSSDGSDHGFIDQSVTTVSSPTLSGVNIYNVEAVRLAPAGKAAENITKGQPVYLSGSVGSNPQYSLTDNTIDGKTHVIGLAAETKTTGQSIDILIAGQLDDFDTTDWAEGDCLYISTGGTLINTVPTEGTIVHVAVVEDINANTGSVMLHIRRTRQRGTPAGVDLYTRLGDSAGANKIEFRDYANNEVASLNSDGRLDLDGILKSTGATLSGDLNMDDNNIVSVSTIQATAFNIPGKRIEVNVFTSTGINNAISELSNGGIIKLLPGEYNITTPIVISTHNIMIEGSGYDTILQVGLWAKWSVSSSCIVAFDKNNFILKDLVIDGNSANSGRNVYLLHAWGHGNSGLTINNCKILYSDGHGLYIRGYNEISVINNYLENCDADGITINGYDGSGYTGGWNTVISGNKFKDNADNGIDIFSLRGAVVSNNTFYSNTSFAIRLSNISYGLTVLGNTSYQDGSFLYAYMNENLLISGNSIFDSVGTGIQLTTPFSINVVNNLFYSCGNSGLYVVGYYGNTNISNNIFRLIANTYNDIYIYGNHASVYLYDINIANNIFTATAGNSERAVYLNGKTNKVNISNNNSSGHDTCFVEITTISSNTIITNNIINDTVKIINNGYQTYMSYIENGKIVIGTTTAPTCMLDVNGTIKSTAIVVAGEIKGDTYSGAGSGLTLTEWNEVVLDTSSLAVNDIFRVSSLSPPTVVRVASGTTAGTYLKQDFTWATPAGAGDMTKAVYDTGDNSIVDNSEALNGKAYAHFVTTGTTQDITGTKTFTNVAITGTIDTSDKIWYLVYSTTIINAVSTITISGLNSDTDISYKLELEKSTQSAIGNWNLYGNNDIVKTNYYVQMNYLDNTTYANSRINVASIIYGGGGYLGYTTVNISVMNGRMVWISNGLRHSVGTGVIMENYRGISASANKSPLTSISIGSNSPTGIGIDSKIRLFVLR